MYIAGAMNSVSRVPIDNPAKITSPMSCRPAAPAPLAQTRGTTPSTMIGLAQRCLCCADIRVGVQGLFFKRARGEQEL